MRRKKVILEVITPGVYGYSLAHARKTRIDANAQAARLAQHYTPELGGWKTEEPPVNITPEQQHVVRALRYYKDDSKGINDALINEYKVGLKDYGGFISSKIEHLDSLFNTPAPENITAFHGMSQEWAREKLTHMKAGDTLYSPAYLSTSLKPSLAIGFAGAHLFKWNTNKPEDGVHTFQVEVPQGYTKGHFVGHIAGSPEEQEFLLKHGQHFRYHGIISDEMDKDAPDIHHFIHKITPLAEH